ncbi:MULTISPECIES: ABC transporter substrate-binding protein [Clostridium]|uniref:ABC transporter substrate-binding protein n=1 Tax=Clostridium TaxID=1485 RepID=UPI000401DE97|nr:spermidine/putrescine ABC transporter substrate-binding protein [Clostridium cadaveris]MDU4952674.1 spermidine/putrescine ABC transporter substrate-binding protein [Clostridium sp.]MDY4947922.1 spermidine/putrescine ABC transporter substrate-binding protein [Clostridium cadaveris]NME63427.1 spermidine/putrescine ABC transporter substrate-binding protein [Clostridium cadaveris]NWK12422.1 spermidine/putrescine ABC transporter substrate-binding protein [Clostridium cadaveris]UFH65714.1 spermid
MKNIKKIIALALTSVISVGLLAGCGSKSSAEVLNIYNVGDYIDEDLIPKFEKETGIKVVYEKYDTNEIMYQKIKSGGSKYDLVFPSDYMIEKMIKEDLLQKIDYSNIPNYKNIDEKFKNASYDPKDEYSVPYFWGTFGIMYNKTMVSDPIESWDILWNEKYKQQILMLDSVRDTMGIALMKLGYSQNSINEAELQKAKEELIKQRPLVLAYGNDDIKDRLLGGEAAMGIVYSGDAITLMEEDKNLAYAIPKTGTNKWIDAMCIPYNAENKKEAEKFINFMLDAQNAKQNIDYINYSTPNKAAFELLDEEVKNNPVAYPSDDIVKKSEFFIDLGDKIKLYDDLWLEIKSK